MKKAKVIIKKRVWSGWVKWWFRPIWIVLKMIDSWKKKIVYLSQGDVFVLDWRSFSRYEIKVVKVRDHFMEVESLSRDLYISHDGVVGLGKSLELRTTTKDAGATWKLSLKGVIEE